MMTIYNFEEVSNIWEYFALTYVDKEFKLIASTYQGKEADDRLNCTLLFCLQCNLELSQKSQGNNVYIGKHIYSQKI